MELTLTTPAILFPTNSLLMVAYTNRFLKVASRIRQLHETYRDKPDENIKGQIETWRTRVEIIKNMQAFGIVSLLLCVLCILFLFLGLMMVGKIIFGASLFMLLWSLSLSFREVQISVEALNLTLCDMEKFSRGNE